MADRHDDRSSEEIRRELEGTRQDLHETVDALERKMSVGQIVDEVWDRIGGRGAVGAAASSLGDAVRENPVPLALMGLGVAWLAVDRATGSTRRRTGSWARTRGRGREGAYGYGYTGAYDEGSSFDYVEEEGDSLMDEARSKLSQAAADAKDKASELAGRVKDKASELREGADGHELRERAGMAGERMRHAARDRARQARNGLQTMMEEQPLVLGAITFGLGLASGLAVPTTRWEDETIGETADHLKERARSTAEEVGRSAKEVAKDTARAARKTAEERSRDEGLRPGGSKERGPEGTNRPQGGITH